MTRRDLASASDEQLLTAVAEMFDAIDPPSPRTVAAFASAETVRGLLVAYDRTGAIVTPLAARGPVQRASRPSYPGSTSRVLGQIDAAVVGAELYDAAWRDNARLRRERDQARADCVLERTRRQDAQVRLATAETQRDAALAELDAARDRIAQLVLTLRALGEETDPAGHESAEHDEEGSE